MSEPSLIAELEALADEWDNEHREEWGDDGSLSSHAYELRKALSAPSPAPTEPRENAETGSFEAGAIDAANTEGWIGTQDRLPEVIEYPDGSVNCVLVYKKDGWECGSDIQVSNTVWLNKNKNWATHWMPLPEPPQSPEEVKP